MNVRRSGGAPLAMLRDRREAGRMLARRLLGVRRAPEPLVLAVPRGGVPVAFEIALALRAPLDVLVVRNLSVPGHGDLALGAVASGGIELINRGLAETIGMTDAEIEQTLRRETGELLRREASYRRGLPAMDVKGREIVLVDDGIATGASMHVAIRALRRRQPRAITVAVPVAPPESVARLADVADEVTCLLTPTPFWAVGNWYLDFARVEDEEVTRLLALANASVQVPPPSPDHGPAQHA